MPTKRTLQRRVEQLENSVKIQRIIGIIWMLTVLVFMAGDWYGDHLQNQINEQMVELVSNVVDVIQFQDDRINALNERFYYEVESARSRFQFLQYVAKEVEELKNGTRQEEGFQTLLLSE